MKNALTCCAALLAAVEAAVRETLTSRGHALESFTLQFDDPTF